MQREDWSRKLWRRRGEGHDGGEQGRRVESLEGERGKGGLLRNKWEVDMGAEVTSPSVGIVFGSEVLMHVPFWLPKMSKK